MILMSDFLEKAIAKLDEGHKSGNFDRYATAMKTAVRDALKDFCRQDEEFAQAVAQGGSFADCMKAVAKNCGSSISDLEAYRRAVRFYFPGAEIRMQMTIDLIGEAAQQDSGKPANAMILDFTQFL